MTSCQAICPVGDVDTQQAIEALWATSLSGLQRGLYEIIVPAGIRNVIGQEGIDAIADRFSSFIHTRVSVLYDPSGDVIRILPPPVTQLSASSTDSPGVETAAAQPVTIEERTTANVKSKLAKDRIAKVPRPPNAFILYRQDHHYTVKSQHPDIHNNQISIIIGNMWKNENQAVLDSYKQKATDIKNKHNELYPDYQYQPRRPSEKKKRMTKRKELKIAMSQSRAHGLGEAASYAATATEVFYGFSDADLAQQNHTIDPAITWNYNLPEQIPDFELHPEHQNILRHVFDIKQPGLLVAKAQHHNELLMSTLTPDQYEEQLENLMYMPSVIHSTGTESAREQYTEFHNQIDIEQRVEEVDASRLAFENQLLNEEATRVQDDNSTESDGGLLFQAMYDAAMYDNFAASIEYNPTW